MGADGTVVDGPKEITTPIPLQPFGIQCIERRLQRKNELIADRYQPIAIIRATHPVVADRLELMWGSSEFLRYVDTLVFGARNGRQYLPFTVMQAILALARFHQITGGNAESGAAAWISGQRTGERSPR